MNAAVVSTQRRILGALLFLGATSIAAAQAPVSPEPGAVVAAVNEYRHQNRDVMGR